MRKAIPFILLGLLTAGTVAGLAVGIAGHSPAGRVINRAGPANPADETVPTTTPPPPATTLPLEPKASGLPACSLVTSAEASRLLSQIVNNPKGSTSLSCGYQGLVVLPPATSPPILTINEIVAPSEVASVKAELGGGLKLLCSEAPAGTSCASVAASNHVTTLDGAPAIWSQTSSSTQGEVGSAVTDIGNRVVQVAVIGESQAGVIAFKALSEVASVLASAP